ncbi:MAG: ABC transporter ATP-binding protein [Opitutaceae bacterium]|jgi:ABC-2 type transport system ATP-binding protein|nr:ABC transporter ATP-binding protein [Opitutaceae bacterium]
MKRRLSPSPHNRHHQHHHVTSTISITGITNMNIMETQNLSHTYWRTEAVRSLTFAIPQGGACALLGQNGAGKTTTIKMLMNLLRPTAGSATVLGADSRRLGPAQFRQIGYVSENQKTPAGMTVRGFLDFCRALYPAWDKALETKLLALFQLPPKRKLAHLSRGMRMKAMLLSSLAYRPKLIVMDEPFSGLDPLVRDELTHGLLELAGAGEWTLLISSHDIDDVERLVDRTVIIEAGKLLLDETLESLQRRFRRVEIFSPQPSPVTPPASCIACETNNQHARWIETQYTIGTEHTCRTLFPGATFSMHPMTLKEIYIATVKNTAALKGKN